MAESVVVLVDMTFKDKARIPTPEKLNMILMVENSWPPRSSGICGKITWVWIEDTKQRWIGKSTETRGVESVETPYGLLRVKSGIDQRFTVEGTLQIPLRWR